MWFENPNERVDIAYDTVGNWKDAHNISYEHLEALYLTLNFFSKKDMHLNNAHYNSICVRKNAWESKDRDEQIKILSYCEGFLNGLSTGQKVKL